MKNGINVIVRKKPSTIYGDDNVLVDTASNIVEIHENKTKVDMTRYEKIHKYPFDKVYNENNNTQSIYNTSIKPHVLRIFDKIDFICYAYGQTGSGKTYTIFGNNTSDGLLSMSASDIFYKIASTRHTVKISAYEIYNDEAYDLLNGKHRMQIREGYNKVLNIVGLAIKSVGSYSKFIKIFQDILLLRNTGISSQNDTSSRSHAIFEIGIYNKEIKVSKLLFVDLAGSERGSQSICKNRLEYRENSHINKSLLALKECIRSVKNNKGHIPFRSSKLTTILRDSFSTNCSTLVIGTIRPETHNIIDGLNTLLYTSSIKYIKKIDYATKIIPTNNRIALNEHRTVNKPKQKVSIYDDDDFSDFNDFSLMQNSRSGSIPLRSNKSSRKNIYEIRKERIPLLSNSPKIEMLYEHYQKYIENMLRINHLELDLVKNLQNDIKYNTRHKKDYIEYIQEMKSLMNKKQYFISNLDGNLHR